MIAPLNWGIGHATRCTPIIHKLLEKEHEVLVATDGRAAAFLKQEFPQLKHINLPGYNINYQKEGNFALNLAKQVPKIFANIRKEHKATLQIVREHQIDGIISDNRFGLYHPQKPTVFMSHQLNIAAPHPMLEKVIAYFNNKYIRKFGRCWIPDAPPPHKLSGSLSTPPDGDPFFQFTGTLSRLNKLNDSGKHYDFFAIISGPEPQRSIFEDKLKQQLLHLKQLKGVVVRGLPELDDKPSKWSENIIVYPHLPSGDINRFIAASDVIISRSGYSTMMDLAVYGSKALFIPTPGQTEQELLALWHQEAGNTATQKQQNMDIRLGMEQAMKMKGIPKSKSSDQLEMVIDDFLHIIH